MNRLYLHIGTHETGAPVLRRFLSENRERLSERGIHFPDTGPPGHACLAAALRRGDRQPLLDLLASPEAARHPAVLLSSGDFAPLAAEAGFLREVAPQVTVVVYLRRQDRYLETAYQTSVQSPEERSTLTFAEFFANSAAPGPTGVPQALDWHELVARWAAVFGRGNVVVRPCEQGQLAGGTAVTDFLGVLGLAPEGDLAPAPPGGPGPGLSREIVELLRLSNELRGDRQQARLVQLLEESAAAGADAAPTRPAEYLSPPQRSALLAQVDPGNRRIAQEFLGRQDGRLFLEPPPDRAAPWQEEGFDFRRLVPPLVGLIAHLHRETLELSRLLRQAEQRLEKARSAAGPRAPALPWHELLSPRVWWQRRADERAIAASGLVDAAYYRTTYPDVAHAGMDAVAHYVRHGWREGRNPSPGFNTRRYLAAHPEAAASGRCPLVFLAQRASSRAR